MDLHNRREASTTIGRTASLGSGSRVGFHRSLRIQGSVGSKSAEIERLRMTIVKDHICFSEVDQACFCVICRRFKILSLCWIDPPGYRFRIREGHDLARIFRSQAACPLVKAVAVRALAC